MSFENGHIDADLSPRDETLQDDGRTPLALAAGLVAALVAGGIWAGLVIVTNTEIGYVAWGVGLLVGFAMSRMTVNRSRQLAIAAAAFAVLGLLAGKAFIFAGSAGYIAKDLVTDEQAMSGAIAWHMYSTRELDEATLNAIDETDAAGDTLSDALWAQMNDQAAARLAAMSPEERHEAALLATRDVLQSIGMVSGIVSQLSLFDLLWLFLAVGTAFRMLSPAREEPAAEPVATV